MQKIYEDQRSRYIWNFQKLGLSYCEIPKTGSSSTKTVLFRLNYDLEAEYELQIGGGQLARTFPASSVEKYEAKNFLDRILIIYRDPIARVKSAYRSIFLGRQGLTGSLSEYFDKHFQSFLHSEPRNGLLNHHKPMTWFFPNALLDDTRTIFVETSELNLLPSVLDLNMDRISTKESKMPHLLNVNKKLGEIDMSDEEIKAALGSDFDRDFAMYEKLASHS
ncbi:MAG: sulfotransferase family 2 domain-containing protein [Rhodobacteraceae bacterium]|nr:sulfotransferase family 2 domain-containing protein [Paracoccaceae bacterium]